jgi:integrase
VQQEAIPDAVLRRSLAWCDVRSGARRKLLALQSLVSRWMGHSKVELTVKRYDHFAPENADQWAWAASRETVKAELAG